MPYIGKEVTAGQTETVKDSFNGDNSTTAFTLSRSVSLDTDIEVFVDNIQQEPGSTKAYSVSGTTLTFTEAPPTGTGNVYVVHRNSLQGTLLPPQNLGDRNYLIGGNLSLDKDSAVLNFGADSDINLTHVADTGLTTNGDFTVGDDLVLNSDSSVIKFGSDSEITLTHVADTGLNIKHTATGDDKPVILTLQTGETDIAQNDVLGTINFQAPDEGTDTDSRLVAAGISAISEGDFSSSSNATKLSFKTGASEAAAEKLAITSGGNVNVVTDGASINFGADSEISLTHRHNDGLILKHNGTGSGSRPALAFHAGEEEITDGDVLGKLEFQAPDETSGTDAVLIGAEIRAVAETTFATDNNSTALEFRTAETAAASTNMTLTAAGRLGIGVTDPDQLLELNDQTTAADVGIHFAGNGVDHTIGIDGSNGGFLTISNNATIGTSPYFTFGASTRIFAGAASNHSAIAGGGISIKPTSNDDQLMLEQENGSNGAEGWLFHASSAGGPLTFARRTGSSNTDHFRISNSGVLTGTDTDGIGSISDERLKKDIVDFTYSFEDFKKFKPRKFNWKTPELHNNETNTIGFIAQELETVDNRFVYETTYYDVKDTDEYKELETKVTNKTASESEETRYNEMKLKSEQKKDNLDKQYLDADGIAKASKLLKKDAMYISIIQQLITKIETLETKVKTLEDE